MRRGKLRREQEKTQEEREFASKKFRAALSLLLTEEKIIGFIETHKNSTLDQEGIDWLVYLRGGLTSVIQIKQKTSRRLFRSRLKRHFEIHPHVINVFGIERRHKPKALARRIAVKINKMIRQTREIDFRSEPKPQTLASAKSSYLT